MPTVFLHYCPFKQIIKIYGIRGDNACVGNLWLKDFDEILRRVSTSLFVFSVTFLRNQLSLIQGTVSRDFLLLNHEKNRSRKSRDTVPLGR